MISKPPGLYIGLCNYDYNNFLIIHADLDLASYTLFNDFFVAMADKIQEIVVIWVDLKGVCGPKLSYTKKYI